MGLDMYLYRKTYLPTYGQHKLNVEVKGDIDKIKPAIKSDKIEYIDEEIAYWRKANAIHNFIVQNAADGVDECQVIEVSTDLLQDLVNRCKRILNESKIGKREESVYSMVTKTEEVRTFEYLEDTTLAQELLPTQAGFFFGSTEFDDWYIEQLRNTIDQIEPYISEDADNGYSTFYYEASW